MADLRSSLGIFINVLSNGSYKVQFSLQQGDREHYECSSYTVICPPLTILHKAGYKVSFIKPYKCFILSYQQAQFSYENAYILFKNVYNSLHL